MFISDVFMRRIIRRESLERRLVIETTDDSFSLERESREWSRSVGRSTALPSPSLLARCNFGRELTSEDFDDVEADDAEG